MFEEAHGRGFFRPTPFGLNVMYLYLQGAKDPRGRAGMTATGKRGLRCCQPPLWGLTK
jgi:hypothetical protein